MSGGGVRKHFGRLAIVKPDHLGDLVLSLPNIEFLISVSELTHLFVAPDVAPIASQLLTKTEIRTIETPHLSKLSSNHSPEHSMELGAYDQMLLLRHDHILDESWSLEQNSNSFCVGNSDERTHETFGQADRIAKIVGHYDVEEFGSHAPHRYPTEVKRVGLSIGSGFPTNIWPLINWLELADQIRERGADVALIGGPAERHILAMMQKLAGLPAQNVIVGTPDIHSFLAAVGDLDVVVASDGGTGHLCSLVTPVISLQTSGPWRRYAPFGAVHRVVTRNLVCAPCVNFQKNLLNLCASRECSYLLLPEHVIYALFCPQAERPCTVYLDRTPDAQLVFGASHLGRSLT